MARTLCTVYNADHAPLAIVTAQRGLIITLKGKATILEELPDRKFRAGDLEFPIPVAIVLKTYRNTGTKYYGIATLNQKNLFVRDGYRCVYCKRHVLDLKSGEYPTRDHVVPTSKGGKDIWTNVVTACSTCNRVKDDVMQDELRARVVEFQLKYDEAKEAKHEKAAARYLEQLEKVQRFVLTTMPTEPTVFEIMLKRSRRRRH